MKPRALYSEHPVILFDGYCNLCSGIVTGLIRQDSHARFRFASLQSDAGQQILKGHGIDQQALDSVVLVSNGALFIKGEAVLRIISLLGGIHLIFYVFKLFPRRLRDGIYDWVAGKRYGWFGKKDVCMIPSPELKDRFLS